MCSSPIDCPTVTSHSHLSLTHFHLPRTTRTKHVLYTFQVVEKQRQHEVDKAAIARLEHENARLEETAQRRENEEEVLRVERESGEDKEQENGQDARDSKVGPPLPPARLTNAHEHPTHA